MSNDSNHVPRNEQKADRVGIIGKISGQRPDVVDSRTHQGSRESIVRQNV